MRHRLSTMGILLLALALAAVSVVGCSRAAEERKPEEEATPTSVPGTGEQLPPGGITPATGETVVSAVTPAPGAGEQPTSPPVAGTPIAPAPPASTPAPVVTAAPPATAQPPPPSGGGGTVWHTVQQGETLSSIARRYGTTWQAIARANNLVNPNQIYAGQKLKIPTSSGSPPGGGTGCRIRHTVRRGEWVWQIARNYGVSPYDILAANGLTIQSANTIYPGKVLCIP